MGRRILESLYDSIFHSCYHQLSPILWGFSGREAAMTPLLFPTAIKNLHHKSTYWTTALVLGKKDTVKQECYRWAWERRIQKMKIRTGLNYNILGSAFKIIISLVELLTIPSSGISVQYPYNICKRWYDIMTSMHFKVRPVIFEDFVTTSLV